jgi:threonine dehydrogenase-like Zn-dependent dehydrogenase
VGVPAGGSELPIGQLFSNNITVGGGVAPVRAYLPELLDDVLAGRLDPGPVFDATYALADVADAYRDMDARRVIKPLLRP